MILIACVLCRHLNHLLPASAVFLRLPSSECISSRHISEDDEQWSHRIHPDVRSAWEAQLPHANPDDVRSVRIDPGQANSRSDRVDTS